MKNSVLLLALITFFCGSDLRAQYSTVEDITIESVELGQTREIMVHTPIYYQDNPNTLYNVIYVFDSQNRRFFDFVSSLMMLSKEREQGFIVVGIKATTIIEEVDGKMDFVYGRNFDLLPKDTKFMGGRKGNIEAFTRYVEKEVISYVESNYRVLPGRMAIGHSLSASFLLHTLIKQPELFDYYVNVSPNVDYDDEFLVNGLRSIDPELYENKKSVYISHGDEFKYWGWGPANQNAYQVLREKSKSANLSVTIDEYPEYDHMANFIPSVLAAVRPYLETYRPAWNAQLSEEVYKVTFQLEVLNEEDEIYISGNQSSLGDWAVDKIKMNRVAPLVREITLEVQDHVEVKFYKEGKQAWIKWGEDGRGTFPMMLRPKEGSVYSYEVAQYSK